MAEDAASMMSRNPVLGALGTTRAVRRFSPEPVSPDMVDELIWAATRAASPENDQPWEFVVVTDPERRHDVRENETTGDDPHRRRLIALRWLTRFQLATRKQVHRSGHGLGAAVRRAAGAIATSGNSSSEPQCMQTVSSSSRTRPQSGHGRRSSLPSLR